MRSLEELALAVGGRVMRCAEGAASGVSIDSRTLRAGDLFFALKGPNFDGHRFLGSAYASGAWGAVVEDAAANAAAAGTQSGALIAVDDTTRALQEMARARRAEFDSPFVAVTGSLGKTTNKEMIAHVLGSRFRVMKSEGNLNNHLGIPLTLLRASEDSDVAVFELAMTELGEIRFLAEMVRPAIGVVTNVAEVHLESMGSLEAIARAKSELVEALPADGYALLNWDDPRVRAMAPSSRAQVLSYGLGEGARLRAHSVEIDDTGTVFTIDGGGSVRIPVWGRHLVYAALAAIGCAELLGVPAQESRDRLARFRPLAGRSAFRPLGAVRLLDDSYNASPASVRAAVLALCDRPGAASRVVALGDMLELGERAEALHAELGEFIAQQPIDLLLLYGPLSEATRRGALAAGLPATRAIHFATREALAAALRDRLQPRDHLLVKGSRGMAMEKVIALIESDLPAAIRAPGGEA
ncbi:MAG: UDP-N-acetylmuramoyl-tripeptide--D-alanyl-D-alanine ligase [bacterium]